MHKPPEFAAHTRPGQPDHPLADHLREVGGLAKKFADRFESGDWAHLAGLWHDLGKYHPEFQGYIKQKTPRGVNHSLGGALWAMERFGANDPRARILAYLIACHHTGLTNWYGGLSERLKDDREQALFKTVMKLDIPEDIRNAPLPASMPPEGARKDFGLSLWLRMLFSCLVDADFLDTEKYMDGEKANSRNQSPSLDTLRLKLNTHLEGKAREAEETSLNMERAGILAQCRTKAALPPGLFSLSVPTGGGKTLSSMAFALDHAIRNRMERIIYVIPYTSIIEQNAGVFKDIFGPENVIEHHSNFNSGGQKDENDEEKWSPWKLACENWDAPIIVTTNVQFFESLFAARTSRVRKLHNILNSVVILDEAQLLPVAFLHPVLCAIKQLKENYKTSLVFCTATQPALKKQEDNPALKTHGLEDVREIIDDPEGLAERLGRVTILPPEDWNTPRAWEDVADDLLAHERVLCIVNTRKDARDLYRILKEKGAEDGLYHLSALMCPAHRSDVIAKIKERLKADKTAPVRVVSTQLIEAGVDIDFPVVYRALAGLDSIAQAAGRCNREGAPNKGLVQIFVSGNAPRDISQRDAYDTTLAMLKNRKDLNNILQPEAFKEFFRCYYDTMNRRAGGLDQKGIIESLTSPIDEITDAPVWKFSFEKASTEFKLIPDDQETIIVPYGDEGNKLVQELKNLDREKINRILLRRLQPYAISLRKGEFEELVRQKKISSVLTKSGWPVYLVEQNQYDGNSIGFDGNVMPCYVL